jgi:hypothetical protein
MNEQDLKQALHDVIAVSSPPPSMDPSQALDQARRARSRRRAVWAGATAVVVTIGIGAAPAVVANFNGGGSADQLVAGGSSTTQPVSTTVPSSAPTTRKSGDPWPEGQVDRTASAGPRADRAVTLMNDLSASVPAGFTTPDLQHPDGYQLKRPQAQYASNDGEQDYWEYQAILPVRKGDRFGKLLVQSTTPDGKPAMEPCALAKKFWGGTGRCSIVNAGGRKVGVVTGAAGDYEQWAAYRHNDGTVVYLAQAKRSDHPQRAPLTQPVFTNQQLAELVTSAKFKISS